MWDLIVSVPDDHCSSFYFAFSKGSHESGMTVDHFQPRS